MERLPFFDHLGLRWRLSGPDEADEADAVTVDLGIDGVPDDLRGPAGSLQGGVVATLVDVAGASCAARALGSSAIATADLTVHYLAPARVGPVTAAARPLRSGDTGAVAEVRVTDGGAGDRLCAVGLVSVRLLRGRSASGA